MDIRQTVHITLSDEPPKIINGYWHEWVNGEWVNTGIKAEGSDGITFVLSNPSISLKKDSSGNIISYTAAKGELVVLRGNVKINDYSDVVFYSPVNNNCVVTMDRWGRYEVVSVNTSSNNIYSDLKASYKGLVVESRLNIQVVADGVSPALRYRRSFEEPNTPTGNAVGWHQSPDIPVVTESASDTWELEDGFFVSPPVSIVDNEIEIDHTHTKISFATTVPNQSVFIHLIINGPGILLLGHLDGFNPSLYNYRERLISAGQEIVVCVDVPASGSHHIYTSLHYNKQDLGAKVRLTNTNTVWVTQQNPTTKAWSKPIKFTQDNSDNESVFLLSSTEEQPAQPESEKYTDDYIPRLGVNKSSIKDWSVNKPYAAHEIVLYNGAYKQALQAHSGIEPTNTAYWKDYYFWTDDPSPLTATAKYQYIATRDKDNGLWGNYSTPRLWAKYGEDGANGKDGANYLIFGFFSDKIQYKLSPAGIPVIKIEDSTQAGFSVHKLIAPQSTFNVATQKGTFVPSEWELVESIDFIYMQEAYIEHLQALTVTAKIVRTSESGARTEIDSGGIKVFNALETMNIRFGLKNGYAVMEYYDNDNNLLYDLGPGGISKVEVREERWTPVKLIYVASTFENALSFPANRNYKESRFKTEITYYRYTSKIVAGVNEDVINDGRLYNSNNKSSGYIPLGVYTTKSGTMELMMQTNETGVRTYPHKIHPDNEAVYDRNPLYMKEITQYISGKSTQHYFAYWHPGGPEV